VVTLLGQDGAERITPRDWSEQSGSIPWEVLCGSRVTLGDRDLQHCQPSCRLPTPPPSGQEACFKRCVKSCKEGIFDGLMSSCILQQEMTR